MFPARTDPEALEHWLDVIEKTTGLARQSRLAEARTPGRGGDRARKAELGASFDLDAAAGMPPTSQATVRWINDSSKCVPIAKFAVQTLQVDAVSFGGKFPAG